MRKKLDFREETGVNDIFVCRVTDDDDEDDDIRKRRKHNKGQFNTSAPTVLNVNVYAPGNNNTAWPLLLLFLLLTSVLLLLSLLQMTNGTFGQFWTRMRLTIGHFYANRL